MQRLKKFARKQRRLYRSQRARFAKQLLESVDGSHRPSLYRSTLLLVVYVAYLAKRFGQDLLQGKLPRHWVGIPQWHREKFSQFLYKLVLWSQPKPPFDPYPTYQANNRLTETEAQRMRQLAELMEHRPLFSIIVPVYNAREPWLERLIQSVLAQTYDRWELLLVDDGSKDAETHYALGSAENRDERITVEKLPCNSGVVRASNRGVDLAHGEFLVFLDHDDELTPDALWYVAAMLNRRPNADVIYSDEELVTEEGFAYPAFKPGFSPELLTAYNYICHLLVVRRQLFDTVGRFRPGTEGAQDYDLVLRLLASTDRFYHIPRILYRWHVVPASMSRRVTTSGILERIDDLDAVTLEVVQTHLDRFGVPARAVIKGGWVQPAFRAVDEGKVAIIICSRDNPWKLWRAVRSIQRRTEYPNYEILIIDNGSQLRRAQRLLEWLGSHCRVLRIPNGPEGFNWAALNNAAARQTDADFLLFLNDDVRVLSRQWLSALVGYHRFPGVGATGARLLFPNRTVQHAGLIVGAMGWGPWHAFRGLPADTNGHGGYLTFPHNCLAVTGACLLTRSTTFQLLGGFDEKQFAVSFNDVDYCLRLSERGLRSVYVPQAELIHHEGASRGKSIRPAEAAALRRCRPQIEDPYWNVNHSRESANFSIRTRRQARRLIRRRPPSVLVVGPERDDIAGGPSWRELFDLLARKGKCTFTSRVLTHAGSQDSRMGPITGHLHSGRFDLLFAQGIEATPAIELAHRLGIISVWHLPEQVQLPPEFDRSDVGAYLRSLRALDYPYQVVFNNPHSMAWAMNGQPRANFSLIEHAPLELTQRPARDKTILQELWGIPEDRIVLLSVCRPTAGNGWEALLNAVRRLPRELRAKTAVLLVGIGPADFRYVQRLRHYLARIENGVLVIDPENLDLYYRAADIFVAHEAEDLRPTAVLKALAAGLPILGSEYLERSELLHRNVTGIVIPPHDDRSLARSLAALLTDGALRTEMGIHAFDWLASRSHPDVIVENWEKLLLEAAELSDSFGRPARSLVSSSEIEVPAGDRLAAAGAT